ncbi:MAG TPA: kelch repeat-containing protein, partial [Blastocatellia bacterium]
MLRRISEITLRRKVFMLGLVFAFCLVAVFTANNALFGKVTAFNGAETDANPPASGSFDPGDWVNDSSMPTARSNPAASLLPSGKLLVVGGSKVGQAFVTDAAIYDPVFSTWQAITPIPIAHRVSAQLLNTGEVLVVGDDDNTVPNPSSFLYNEGSSSWSATTGPPSIKRYQPALALLTTGSLAGQVLMAGGYDNNCCTGPSGTYNTTELYNPTTKTWAAGPAMNTARLLHTATVLANGQVLVVGGALRDPLTAYNSAELYTSGGSSWTLAAPMTAARYAHTATRLPSGEVLVVGGANGTTALNSVELYNPTSDTWSTKTPMTVARQLHTATLLPSGKVLIAGGQNISGVSTDSAELYDPATNTWSDAGPLNDARGRHIAALLSCGRVLVAGGTGAGGADLATAEIYTQKDPFITVTPTALNNGVVGQSFTQDFSPVGGMGPFTYSQPSGDLPKGMTLQPDGKLTGIPEEKGSFTFTVKATDKNGCMGTVTITWQVDCPTIVISPATVHSGIAGQSYSPIEQLTATGGT